jgi:hypothetical protein
MKYTSPLIATASGSLAGATFSHNAGGQYMRRREVPVNPQTGYQTNVRNAMAAASVRWTTVLTEVQRQGWRTWAEGITIVNTLGQAIKLSGFQHYVRINALAFYTIGITTSSGGFVGTDVAPVGSVIGPSAAIVSAAVVRTTGPPLAIELTLDFDSVPAGGIVGVWLSPPVGLGRNFWKGPYILADAATAAATTVIDLADVSTPEYSTRFGNLAIGAKVWGYARQQSTDGRIGPRLNFGPIVVT